MLLKHFKVTFCHITKHENDNTTLKKSTITAKEKLYILMSKLKKQTGNDATHP